VIRTSEAADRAFRCAVHSRLSVRPGPC
jgi:hypothetical protein